MSTFKGDSYAYREKTCSFHADFQFIAFLSRAACLGGDAAARRETTRWRLQRAGRRRSGHVVYGRDVAQDLHKLLRRTTGEKTDALLAKNFQTNPAEVSINAFLIAMPGHKILVDTGSGQLFGTGNGGR